MGGAGFTYLVSLTDWSMSFVILALIYLLTAILVTIIPTKDEDVSENRQREGTVTKNSEMCQDSWNDQVENHHTSHVEDVFGILKNVMSTPGTVWLCIYVLIYKLGERAAVNNMPLFLLDKGMSTDELGIWNGFVCQGLSVFGSFYGGVILASKHESVKNILMMHSIYRSVTILVQFLLMVTWEFGFFEDNIFIFYVVGVLSICSLSYSSGLITTATFTLMMKGSRICERKSQATHYSFLASVEVAGKLVLAVISGFIIDFIGITSSFAVFLVLSFLPVVVLRHCPTSFSHLKTD